MAKKLFSILLAAALLLRTFPAVLAVEAAGDLQAAYDAASDGDTITLTDNISLEAYLLFDEDKSVTIDGSGYAITYTSSDHIGSSSAGVMTVTAGEVTLTNLTLEMPDQRGTNGRPLYIGSGATVYANGCTIQNGYSAYMGGGVYVEGGTFIAEDTEITNCYIANNMHSCGGGIYVTGGRVEFGGSLTGNTIHATGNSYNSYGGGIAAVNGSEVLLDGAVITGNTVDTNGGAVYFDASSTVTLSGQVTLSGNTAGGSANNLYLLDENQTFQVDGLADSSVIGLTHGNPAYNTVVGLAVSGSLTAEVETSFNDDSDAMDVRVKDGKLVLYPFTVSIVINGSNYDFSYPTDGETPTHLDFETTITPHGGYELPLFVTVSIGGTATDDFTYDTSTGEIVIPSSALTGSVVIDVEPDQEHEVTVSATHMTFSPDDASHIVTKNDVLTITFQADSRYALPDSVTVNGTCDSSYDSATGVLTIENVNSDVSVSAVAAEVWHTISFDPATGVLAGDTSKQIKESDAVIGALPQPTKTGYTFSGWFTHSGDMVRATDTNLLTADITLYARWTADTNIQYKINHWLEYVDSGENPGFTSGTTPTQTVNRNGTPVVYYQYGTDTYNDGQSDAGKNIAYLTISEIEGLSVDGFSADSANVYEVVMAADSSSVYNFFYNRNHYTVTFDPTEGVIPSSSPSSTDVAYAAVYGSMPNAERSGYTFAGWFTSPTGGSKAEVTDDYLLTSNQTLYAHWTPNGTTPYTVVHMMQRLTDNLVGYDKTAADYAEHSRETLTGTSDTTVGIYAIALEGYTPSAENAYTIKILADGSAIAYLYYDRIVTAISFDGNGGQLASDNGIIGYDGGTVAALPDDPYRVGYSFSGWYTGASDASLKVIVGTEINALKPLRESTGAVLYAHWTARNYTLNLEAHGGTISEGDKTITYDAAIGDALPTAELAGYTFQGWYTEDGRMGAPEGTQITAGTVVTKDTIIQVGADRSETVIPLYVWYRPNIYTLSFDAGAGEVEEAFRDVVYESRYNDGDNPLPVPARTGYNFIGWFFDLGDTDTKIEDTGLVKILEDSTVHAAWEPKTFRVDLDAKGGTVEPESIIVTYDATYARLPEANRTGYTFDGWFLGDDEIQNSDTVKILDTVTLEARWSPNTYTVAFDAATNGGIASMESKTVTFDAAYGELPTASKSGYTFKGWYTAASNGTQVTAATMVKTTDNHTLFAQFYIPTPSGGGGGGGGGGAVTKPDPTITVETPEGKDTISVKPGNNATVPVTPKPGQTVLDVIVDGSSVGAVSDYTFSNVTDSHKVEILSAATLNAADHISYLQGYPDGTIHPDGQLTRAETAMIFFRLLTPEVREHFEKKANHNAFADVPADAWYAEAVSTLAAMDILKGYGNGQFRPDANISRAELTAIVSRFDALESGENTFPDVPAGHWAEAYIISANAKGWVTGYNDGAFRPEAEISRAEAVKLVNNLLHRAADKDFLAAHPELLTCYADLDETHWAFYPILEASVAHEWESSGTAESWTE